MNIKIHKKNALICCTFDLANDPNCFFGNTRGEIKLLIFGRNDPVDIAAHQGMILGLKFNSSRNGLVSIATDSILKMFDPSSKQKEIFSIPLPKKPIVMDANSNYIYLQCKIFKLVSVIFEILIL